MHLRVTLRFARVVALALSLSVSLWLIATGVSRLVEGPAPVLAQEVTQPVASPEHRPDPVTVARAILERNMFDSHTGPLRWDDTPQKALTAAPLNALKVALEPPERCAGDLRLLGSVVVAREPERSVAMLRVQGESHVVQVGSSLGDTRLVALDPARAYLQPPTGPVCKLPLFLPASERPKVVSAPVIPKTKPAKAAKPAKNGKANKPFKNPFSEAELNAAIRSVGNDRFRVARPFMEKAISNPAALASGARFVTRSSKGLRLGVKVYGVKAGTLLHRLGVRNGDILRSINGIPLADATGMLQAYTQLKERGQLSLAIRRRGGYRTLSYSIE